MQGLSLSLDQAKHYIFPGWLGNIGIVQKKLSYLASLHEFGIKLISANPKKKYQYIPDSTVLYHICFGFNYQTVNNKEVKKLDTHHKYQVSNLVITTSQSILLPMICQVSVLVSTKF